MDATFIRNNLVSIAIAIFIFSYVTLHMFQPGFLYNKDGSLRQFGVGRKLSTVFPSWLVAIIMGIFSYLIAINLLRYSRK
jgi:hypothetical protein